MVECINPSLMHCVLRVTVIQGNRMLDAWNKVSIQFLALPVSELIALILAVTCKCLGITSTISHSADAITRLSFYKEELAGERSNYIHLRASAEELPPMEVLRQLVDEVLDTARRIEKITGTDRELHVLWNEYLQVRIPHA